MDNEGQQIMDEDVAPEGSPFLILPAPPTPLQSKDRPIDALNEEERSDWLVNPRVDVNDCDGGDGGNAGIHFLDHYSLGTASSIVRFRNKRLVLYSIGNYDQIVLESKWSNKCPSNGPSGVNKPENELRREVVVKRYSTSTSGMRFLRAVYSLVVLLLLGFLVAFCFQIILFLFLNMAANAEFRVAHVFAVVASTPIHLYAMASIVAMGTTVLKDTWNGNPLFQQLLGLSSDVMMEAICVIIFFLIPGTTGAVTLLSRQEDWWEVTAWVFVISVMLFMVVFVILVVVNEVRACLSLTRQYLQNSSQGHSNGDITQAVLICSTMFFSGMTKHQYLQNGEGEKEILKSQTTLYSRMTVWVFCKLSWFVALDPPIRIYSAEEIRDAVPFYTARNWSLEKMFCRDPNKGAIYVQKGPGALRDSQIGASLFFSIVGAILILLTVAGVLVWYELPTNFIVFFVILVFLCGVLPVVSSTVRLYQMYHRSNNSSFSDGAEEKRDDIGDHDGAIFKIWEQKRISEPTPAFCWVMISVGVSVGFLWPMISFFVEKEYTTATFFMILGLLSLPRICLNPVPLLHQMGPLQDLSLPFSRTKQLTTSSSGKLSDDAGDNEDALKQRAKLSAIIGGVNNRALVNGWMTFFGLLMALVGIFSWAAFQEALEGFDYKVKVEEDEAFFAPDFYYPPHPNLPYPTCKVAKSFSLLETDGDTHLLDVAYLAVLAFTAPDETKRLIAEWFSEDEVVDEFEFVKTYREDVDRTTGVSFKLFSFPRNPGVGLVSIRGSEALRDWVVDVQLWLGAALAQIIRALIPLGWIWTPILDDLVYLVNLVESDNLKEVSYYTTTTRFVNDVASGDYGNGSFKNLRVTGASLGGGLATITGAQTYTPTIAISGLNAKITRRTLRPPVSEAAIDTSILNVIPDRDPIAHIDDPGRLVQQIMCRAPRNTFFACHSMWRSICELQYTCGTRGRPALCWCVTKYGYPEPAVNGTRSFAEACLNTQEDQ